MKGGKYSKQRLDPRWQKRRLEIMQRDEFQCVDCGASDKTLNVHHIYYTTGAAVWDYPDHALVTLCCECHEAEHDAAHSCERALVDAYNHVGLKTSYLGVIAFTIDQVHGLIGHEKTKHLIEMLDFIMFRSAIEESTFSEIEALHNKLKQTVFSNDMDGK